MPDNKKIILLQGAGINIDRGAEELLDAMRLVDNAILLIIGSGDVWTTLREKIKKNYLEEKVFLIDKIPKQELMHYTFNADLGLSIDKNTNLNYVNSLPNKIFDYIQAGVPILASRLPEIEKIINDYKIGDFIADHQPENIAFKINEMLSSDKLLEYKNNTKLAAKELNWANEKQKLISVIKSVTLKTT
ncbi:MAG: glycosyltransferase [Sediminibacterium sp.]|nr:glycosyltransferase [Sediminibacterium sp.]MDP3567600.1 glycosyltransferase [Sediminibacterium sp.]